jgi:hypothetical protein
MPLSGRTPMPMCVLGASLLMGVVSRRHRS